MPYYAVHRRPHRTMTELEQAKVTGEHVRGFRRGGRRHWPPSRAAGTFGPIAAGGIASGNGMLFLLAAGENG